MHFAPLPNPSFSTNQKPEKSNMADLFPLLHQSEHSRTQGICMQINLAKMCPVRVQYYSLHRKSFPKSIGKFRSKGPVLSVDPSPQKFHKRNCKFLQQKSGLLSGCFTVKIPQSELQSFAAKVRSYLWRPHRKRFTKGIAKFRSKGPVLSVDASPQKFHRMNCKVSHQRSRLVSGCFSVKVSQNELQRFAPNVWSSNWTLHHKKFTK